jgi:hypothetical protein
VPTVMMRVASLVCRVMPVETLMTKPCLWAHLPLHVSRELPMANDYKAAQHQWQTAGQTEPGAPLLRVWIA